MKKQIHNIKHWFCRKVAHCATWAVVFSHSICGHRISCDLCITYIEIAEVKEAKAKGSGIYNVDMKHEHIYAKGR